MKSTCLKAILLSAIVFATLTQSPPAAEKGKYKEGQYPPPTPPAGKWDELLAGKLEDQWTDINVAIHSATFTLKSDPTEGPVLAVGKAPTGLIRTLKPYENFILEVEWRHLTEAPSAGGGNGTTGNSGLYVWADPLPTIGGHFTRAIEVQVCNLGNGAWYTSHGDLFPIWGASMIPDPRFGVSGDRSMPIEFRCKKTGEWNHCRINCVDGTIQEEINGALVSAGFRASPRKGYICIESEGGPAEFRHMRVQELPGDPHLQANQIAALMPAGTRATCLYNGMNLDGWTVADGQADEWKANDHNLHCVGKTKGDGLSYKLPAGDFTLQLDWAAGESAELPFKLDGLALEAKVPGKGWKRMAFQVRDNQVAVTNSTGKTKEETKLTGKPTSLHLMNPGQSVSFCNIMVVESPKSDAKP